MGRRLSARDRWAIASRTAAASVGGYIFTWLSTAALALLLRHTLPMTRVEAMLTASMASFLILAVIIIAIFHARTATRAWLGLLIASLAPIVVLASL